MKVCVVGSGGREHALASVLGRDHDVVVTPGNPGIPGSVATPPEELTDIDLFVIGPEVPLVAGLADRLRSAGNLVFGPGADGARMEGSKAWMKEVLADAGVATARHGTFTDEQAAIGYLDSMGDLFVVKTDGLAAGKGVLVTESRAEAVDAVRSYLSGAAFGDAGRTVVIEEGLTGPELSVLAICDGRAAVALAPAQDFKRIGEGDTGPNTGGMGAYSPVPEASPDLVGQLMSDAVEPTLAALNAQGIHYRGVLYAGLMLTPDGPKMLEYNVRFGDPEAQVVLPRLESDLGQLLAEAAGGAIKTTPVFTDEAAVTVVLASEGYPASPRSGDYIEGLDAGGRIVGVDDDRVTVFCAGVARDDAMRLVTAGGRVLNVTALGATIADARSRAYRAIDGLSWSGMQFRRDIAALAEATC